jgi:hypothetical protein
MWDTYLPTKLFKDRLDLLNRPDYLGYFENYKQLASALFDSEACDIEKKYFIWETFDRDFLEHLTVISTTVSREEFERKRDSANIEFSTGKTLVGGSEYKCSSKSVQGLYTKFPVNTVNDEVSYKTLSHAIYDITQHLKENDIESYSRFTRYSTCRACTPYSYKTHHQPWSLKRLCAFYVRNWYLYREKDLESALPPDLVTYIQLFIPVCVMLK